MHFRRGFRHWWSRRAQIANKTQIANEKWGIVRVVGVPLYVLTVASPTTLAYIGFGTEDRPLYWFTDACVVGSLILSVGIYYLAPNVCLAWLSTYFSAITVIVLLNIVLLQRVFGGIASPERSLLLFMCNVAQIVFMFGTWYRLCAGYSETEALLKSILTFATISYADKVPRIAMAQIATDFALLAIFLSHLVGQLGPKNGVK
jgi:hypothetical protein